MDRQRSLIMSLVRATAVAVVLLMVTILTVGRSGAAFTATTASSSSFATGTVVLTDDDSGSALFTATDMTAGSSVTDCITVTYSGTILPAPIRMYGSTTGSLDTYLDATIEIGTGGSLGDCNNAQGLTSTAAITFETQA